MTDPTPTPPTDAERWARTHRPNYVIEAPGTEREWTRVKCDGDACDFYAERRGWRNWFKALNAHSDHVAVELDALLATARADAVKQVADRWQWGAWADVLAAHTGGMGVAAHLGRAQAVTDWLRGQVPK